MIFLTTLSRRSKQIILLVADVFILYFSIYLTFVLRFNSIVPIDYFLNSKYFIIFIYPIIAIPIFIKYGLYRAVLKHIGYKTFLATFYSITISTFALIFFSLFYNASFFVMNGVLAINWFVSLFAALSIRIVSKQILYNHSSTKNFSNIAIYGCGDAGIKLANSIQESGKYNLKFFIDDDLKKTGTVINSIKVYSLNSISDLILKENISLILLAIPSASRKHRTKLLNLISQYPLKVMELPSVENIIDGKVTINDIVDVDVSDVMNRKINKPIKELLKKNIYNKNILVTGAGGSIGSELCRQILSLGPLKLVLYELSEYSLYKIDYELREINKDIEIVTILGTVLNKKSVQNTYRKHNIHTVYHAAAYKHVPLVESNPISGILNNVMGTYNIVKYATENNVESLILISTDKAVRPTNIMGATKRFAELILQGYSKLNNYKTILSIVRFGNVLDSAGSVLPLFREQIKNGGPVTVTHPEVFRYFMSIPEAVELVLQSGSMADGGEVFILDMGDPVNILEMAKRMIFLSGYTPDYDGNSGDIEIKITGLRPGEKLYEELLVGEKSEETKHPQIMKAKERSISINDLEKAISDFQIFCENGDSKGAVELLSKYVEGFKS